MVTMDMLATIYNADALGNFSTLAQMQQISMCTLALALFCIHSVQSWREERGREKRKQERLDAIVPWVRYPRDPK